MKGWKNSMYTHNWVRYGHGEKPTFAETITTTVAKKKEEKGDVP